MNKYTKVALIFMSSSLSFSVLASTTVSSVATFKATAVKNSFSISNEQNFKENTSLKVKENVKIEKEDFVELGTGKKIPANVQKTVTDFYWSS